MIRILYAYLGASALTFLVYGFDKRRAVKGGSRVSEKTLHLLLEFLSAMSTEIAADSHDSGITDYFGRRLEPAHVIHPFLSGASP